MTKKKLEKKVRQLEIDCGNFRRELNRFRIEVPTKVSEEEWAEYGFYGANRSYNKAFTLVEAITAIIDHLGIKFDIQNEIPEKIIMVKKEGK